MLGPSPLPLLLSALDTVRAFPGKRLRRPPIAAVLWGVLAFGCGASRDLTSSAPAVEAPLAITDVTVVDVRAGSAGAALDSGYTVIVERGVITRVGASGEITVPPGSSRVDGRGKYLIPGLWDAHSHLSLAGEAGLIAYVANGVTTVRDLGSQLAEIRRWRAAMDAGRLTGPRILTAGQTIEAAWWLDPALALLAKDPVLARFPIVEMSPAERLGSPADAVAVIDAIVASGVDLIKFRNLRGDEFHAVAGEAVRRGLALAGHAPSGVPIGEAAEQGLRTFEHAETVTARLGSADAPARRAQLSRVAAAGSAITPTLITDVAYRQTPDSVATAAIGDNDGRIDARRRYVGPVLLARWQFGLDLKRYEKPADWAAAYRRQVADIRLAYEAGVPLLAGTDLGVSLVYPGFSVHDELKLLVDDAGVSPLDALKAATINPARAMRLDATIGTIEAGRRADLVLLTANPLDEIGNTVRIDSVILAGRRLDRSALDNLLAEAAASLRNAR
jgi:imidazolonepropionase-like amidohydrolase